MKNHTLTVKLSCLVIIICSFVYFGVMFYKYKNCEPVDVGFDLFFPSTGSVVTIVTTTPSRQGQLPFWYTHYNQLSVDEQDIHIRVEKEQKFYLKAGVSEVACSFHEGQTKIDLSKVSILVNGEKQNFYDEYPRIRYPVTYQSENNKYIIDFSYDGNFKTRRNVLISWE